MQCARAIPVTWLGSGSCQARPSRLNTNEWTKKCKRHWLLLLLLLLLLPILLLLLLVVGILTGNVLDDPGIESRLGPGFSAPVQTGPGAHPASCTIGTGYFLGVKSGRGVKLSPHPLLMSWSRKSRAIPLLPLWALRPVWILSACTRVQFTTFYYWLLVLCSSTTHFRINWDNEPSRYGENPDNWIFLSKWAVMVVWSCAIVMYSAYFCVNISKTPYLEVLEAITWSNNR